MDNFNENWSEPASILKNGPRKKDRVNKNMVKLSAIADDIDEIIK